MEREAVRIDVILPIEVYPISAKELEHRKSRIVGDVPIFSYIPLKDTFDEALNNWLKLINAKLDYLINLLTREKEGFNVMPLKKVNISEKGLRLSSETPLEPNTFVEIKLVLDLYEPLGLYLYGKIIRCEKKEEHYEIALEWINLTPDIKEKLGFYILQKERELIRERKGF
ncbi:MAG: PilZ domain-containing protein [Caldimicrobium sp.]|jgi:c-di-GMP-binding flagellar brake protein YcgR